MKIDEIMSLRPRDDSSAEVRAALARASETREALSVSLAALLAQGNAVLLTGTLKERGLQDAAVREAREGLERVSAMIDALQDLLPKAERREEIASLHSAYAELRLDEHAAAFARFMQNDYPQHARAIAAGMALEVKVVASWPQANRIVQRLAALGEETPVVPHPSIEAVGPLQHQKLLSTEVRLPGAFGAPFVAIEQTVDHVTRVIEEIDWARVPESLRVSPQFGKVYPKRYVERTVDVPRAKLVREDAPIWPPDPRAWISHQR